MAEYLRISATIRDEWGIETPTQFYAQVPDTATVNQVLTYVEGLLINIDGVSAGEIVHASYSFVVSTTILRNILALKSSPLSGSRVEQTALLGFSANGTDKRWTGAVPAVWNTPGILSGDRLNLTPLNAVDSLRSYLLTPTAGIQACNTHAQVLTAFVDGMVAFRKRRKQLQRSSFEV